MKTRKLIVIIPVGPGTNPVFLKDTMESIEYYCQKSHKIILVNDSQKPLDKSLRSHEFDEVITPKSMGKQSGLYFSLCLGMNHALQNYNFKVLLRMDDDALITGPEPELEAIKYFNENTLIGILGSHKVMWNGEMRDFDSARKELEVESGFLWRLQMTIRKQQIIDIRPLITAALRNGYELGENAMGGAYFISKKALSLLKQSGLLPAESFNGSRLEEDFIFGILVNVVGMSIGDFVTGAKPMCLKWQGMPTDPDTILKLGKKVVHSTRYFKSLDESQIREIFRQQRTHG